MSVKPGGFDIKERPKTIEHEYGKTRESPDDGYYAGLAEISESTLWKIVGFSPGHTLVFEKGDVRLDVAVDREWIRASKPDKAGIQFGRRRTYNFGGVDLYDRDVVLPLEDEVFGLLASKGGFLDDLWK